ncbi:MAG TPA: mercury methylation ferredoxin HgcB [Malonomonas sp.]
MLTNHHHSNGLRYIDDVTTLHLTVEKCIGCGVCETVCPHRIFAVKERKAIITDRNLCIECGACSKNCPTAAIEVAAGVGCASAIIYSWLTGKEPSCDCSGNSGSC